jgi:hypothetical protein
VAFVEGEAAFLMREIAFLTGERGFVARKVA